jgi:hypothetical protein
MFGSKARVPLKKTTLQALRVHYRAGLILTPEPKIDSAQNGFDS